MPKNQSFTLSVPRGIALYVGALLGPGLLLLPGLAARQAGPASIVAWAGLLVVSALFALVFAAMGRAHPGANGVAGYAAAGLGPTAGRVVGWCVLTGVIGGAPVVCLIGAGYVTNLTGGGLVARGLVAAALLLTVLAPALGGGRAHQRRPAGPGRPADRDHRDRGRRLGAGRAGRQLDAVRGARLERDRAGRGHADAGVRVLGGGGPADQPIR